MQLGRSGGQDLAAGVRTADIDNAFARLERLRAPDLPCSLEAVPPLRTWFERWSTDLLADEH